MGIWVIKKGGTNLYNKNVSTNPAVMHVVKSIFSIPGILILHKSKSRKTSVRILSAPGWDKGDIRSGVHIPWSWNVTSYKSTKAEGS